MKATLLTNTKEEILIDDEDYHKCVKNRSWYRAGKTVLSTKYIQGRSRPLSNFIMNNYNVIYDHKDRNPLNNQKENLRECTESQNSINRNKRKNASSRFLGVSKHNKTNLWRAQIQLKGKRMHIGYYVDEIDAAKAFDIKAKKLFKEFAVLNFTI